MLTHQLWNRLGADSRIIGTIVSFNGRPHTVIGVLPPDFKFVRNASEGPAQRPDAYTNLRVHLADASPNQALHRFSRPTEGDDRIDVHRAEGGNQGGGETCNDKNDASTD